MDDDRKVLPGLSPRNSGRLVESLAQVGLPLLSQLFRPGSRLEQLQERLLELQIQQMGGASATPYTTLAVENLADEESRIDWVVLGDRGGGKTATSVFLAQQGSALQQKPFFALGWPKWAADQVGAKSVEWKEAKDARDCWLLLDEASLRVRTGKRNDELFELLALARHRDVCTVWTSQTSSGVHRDILRFGPALMFKRCDPLASLMDREELVDITAIARSIQEQVPACAGVDGGVIYSGGQWGCVGGLPLPRGWDEKVSRLWS